MAERTVVALDVGGTVMKGAILGPAVHVLVERSWPTGRHLGPDAVVETALAALEELAGHPDARATRAAGLVVPGTVDAATGTVVWSENLGWSDVPLRELASTRTGLPVAFGHDVRVAALAESRLGAARDRANVLFLAIGTGIGAALMVDGHLLEADGYAGEIGHIEVEDSEPCVCGGQGCLEAVASAAAIARRYGQRSGRPVDGAAEVLAQVNAGDPVAAEVWNEAVEYLAQALAIGASLVAPELVVIGGGLSLAGDALLLPLTRRLHELLTIQRRPQLVPADLGDRAACLGAGLLAWEIA
ncbi:ROK family protein [Micromonospora sp. NPDC005087]|uniref:ROK family protein n=1 Tax=Micromonospora sp. NPDC005087 TaxID=3364225 RepID=UPI00367D16A3